MNHHPKCAFVVGFILVSAMRLSLSVGAKADEYTPFEGAKSSWHDGFDRYDYLMDEQSLEIQPFERDRGENFGIKDPPRGKRRCVVVVPRKPAAGNPWSWRGCYWDHQPQTEVELLRRGFHVAYISVNANLKPGKTWDAWYAFLTDKHGLSRKPAFVGMSRGGEYAYTWATANPTKVSSIYADNPGVNADVLKKLSDLAAADVPVLHVCGSIDPLLGRVSSVIENLYQQFGGRISVMIKEGAGHHPHSLRDATPIADFISQQVQPGGSNPPDYLGGRVSRSAFYGRENIYRFFPKEGIYITCRGPWFSPSFDRYSFGVTGVEGSINVIVPKTIAAGKPWVFRADHVNRDSLVDLALLEQGFHIVTGPVPYNADGPSLKSWNAVYELLTKHGFSDKARARRGGWCSRGSLRLGHCESRAGLVHLRREPGAPLHHDQGAAARQPGSAGERRVHMLHVCGSLDPMLASQTREAEKRYNALGGSMTVIVQEGAGHYPTGPKDPKIVVDFIVGGQRPK